MSEVNQIVVGSIRIVADPGACCAYGVCALICPEVFKLNEGGIIALENDTVIVGPELADKAREGAEACPQHVFTVEPVEAVEDSLNEAPDSHAES